MRMGSRLKPELTFMSSFSIWDFVDQTTMIFYITLFSMATVDFMSKFGRYFVRQSEWITVRRAVKPVLMRFECVLA